MKKQLKKGKVSNLSNPCFIGKWHTEGRTWDKGAKLVGFSQSEIKAGLLLKECCMKEKL